MTSTREQVAISLEDGYALMSFDQDKTKLLTRLRSECAGEDPELVWSMLVRLQAETMRRMGDGRASWHFQHLPEMLYEMMAAR